MRQSLTVRRAEHFGINRKIIANMTAQSWHDIPHVVVTNEPEASEFLKVFKEINEGRAKEDKITLNAVILKVITEALKKCPAMNAHIDFKPRLVRGCVTEFDEINISMPMLLDSGEMMTVNLHNMQDKNLRDIRDTLADVQRRAKNSNTSQVMYDVSLNDTLQGLAKVKLVQTIYAYGVVKVFVLCSVVGGEFIPNIETTETKYFGRDELPENLAGEKTSREQILMCFDANESKHWETKLD